MKKLLILGIIIFTYSQVYAVTPKYDLDSNDSIVDLSSPTFQGYVGFSSATHTATPPTGYGWLYYGGTNYHIFFRNELGLSYDLTAGGAGGSGSEITVQEDGVSLGTQSQSINFVEFFNITNDPIGRANIYLDTDAVLTHNMNRLLISTGSYYGQDYVKVSTNVLTTGWMWSKYLIIDDYAYIAGTAYIPYELKVDTITSYVGGNPVKIDDNLTVTGNATATSFIGDGSALTNIFTNNGWEEYWDVWSGNGVQVSTSVYINGVSSATAFYGEFYGSGIGVTGIDHNLNLSSLQGGSSGDITNYNNVTFITPGNYDYNESEITVTDSGVARLVATGAGSSNNWPYTTPSNYTYNTSSITVTGGKALLGQTSTYISSYVHYKLNASVGTTITDDSGNGRNGTTDGSWVTAKINNGLTLTGSQIGSLGNIANFERTTPFSIELWLKTTDTSGAVFHRRGTAAPLAGWDLAMTANTVYFYFANTTVSNMISVYTSFIFADNAWHHYVITYDGSSNANGVKFYIDGTLRSKTIQYNTLTGSTLNSATCYLGNAVAGFGNMNGTYDEVAIYPSVLSLPQVQERYNSGTGTENLPYLSSVYITTDPPIETNNGYTFNSALQTFIETATKPSLTEIKYQLSSNNGITYKYWTGAVWSTSDGTYSQSSDDTDINDNIATLANSGILKVKALLHSTDGTATPELDNIEVATLVSYVPGSYIITMKTDLQPTINHGYLSVVETSSKPTYTSIAYQYSINAGSTYNGSWLTRSNLETALQALSPVGDGSDTIRFKFQLTTSSDTVTPELDNVLVTSNAGTGAAEMFHISSGTYANLTDPTAQLNELQTDGSPEFSTMTVINNIYGKGGNISEIGLYNQIYVTQKCVVDESTGIIKGQVVYVNGSSGGYPTVGLADRQGNIYQSFPVGVADQTKSNGQIILIRTHGCVSGLNTGTLTPGNILYLDVDGVFIDTIPSSGTVRIIGLVSYADATNGKIFVTIGESYTKTSPVNTNLPIRLGDSAGNNKLSIQNYEGTEISSITSQGDAHFNSISGDGSGLTGIISGIHVKEDGVVKSTETASINFNTFFNVSGYNINLDTPTLIANFEPADATIMKEGENVSLLNNDTGYITGIDIEEDGVTQAADMGLINFRTHFNVSAVGDVDIDTTTLKTDLDITSAPATPVEYNIYIGTSANQNPDFVCDGVADEEQFNQVAAIIQPDQSIYVYPAAYYFSGPSTFTVRDIRIVSDKCEFFHDGEASQTTNGTFFYIDSDTVKLSGLVFNGTGFTNAYRYIRLSANSDDWLIKDCIFKNSQAVSNQILVAAEVGASGGTMQDCLFQDCAGSYSIINYDNNCTYTNIKMGGCFTIFEVRGNDNKVDTLTITGSNQNMFVFGASLRCSLLNSILLNGSYGGIINYGDFNRIEDNSIYNMTTDGIYCSSGADGTIICGNVIYTCGGSGDNDDGIITEGDNTIIIANKFYGNMDRAPVYVASTADQTIIESNNFSGVTGNTAIISDNGTNTLARSNLPIQNNFEVLVSTVASGKPNLTPIKVGVPVWTINFLQYMSTGTAADQWQKVTP